MGKESIFKSWMIKQENTDSVYYEDKSVSNDCNSFKGKFDKPKAPS